MNRLKWILRNHDPSLVSELEKKSSVSPVVAQILAARNTIAPEAIDSFLESPLTALRPPEQLHDVSRAVELVLDHVASKRKICIYGDYDADGMTGTAILYRCLGLLNADVTYFVPNRLSDGYGLNQQAIEKLHRDDIELIISVDCGITSIAQVAHAKSLGMSVIITDHHSMLERLPAADAIVHPQHPDEPYPFSGLCGAGVAFKLAWAICQKHSGTARVNPRFRNFLMSAVGLAAMGTIADVVPLLDENRILVKHGLVNLIHHPVVGIQQLMKLTCNDQKPALNTDDIGFSIAPRLNASGRLGQAQLGVELLTTDNEKRAFDLAEYIHHLNDSRESLERGILKAARQQIKDEHLEEEPAIVLAGRGWHAGVIGIVAGRIAEQFHRPTVIIALDAMKSKPGMGSARSSLDVDLYASIGKCHEHLISFGGHPAAAGLRIEESNIDAFRDELCRVVAEDYSISDKQPELQIDAEVPLSHLTIGTLNELQKLAPFGHSNPRPVLTASEITFCDERRMGKADLHFSARVVQHGIRIRCVAFGKGDWFEQLQQQEGPYDIAFRPVINEFRGRRNVEIQLIDFRATEQRSTKAALPEATLGSNSISG